MREGSVARDELARLSEAHRLALADVGRLQALYIGHYFGGRCIEGIIYTAVHGGHHILCTACRAAYIVRFM